MPTVALVNFMPGEARAATEQQFRTILAAADGSAHRTNLVCLPADRTVAADALPMMDGLIVTGMPPRAATLPEEPQWPFITALIDHARLNAIPSIWSCLAAHAAVLYLDGIARRRLPEKLSGLVACTRTAHTHKLMENLPQHWSIPHSRYNEVPEEALRAHGYRILSRGADAADIFVRDDLAPMLFCQGHPEYDAQALFREYRRDIRNFLAGGTDDYPLIPENCFPAAVQAQLEAFRADAVSHRTIETLSRFPTDACNGALRYPWRDFTNRLYSNWLSLVAAARARRHR